MAAICAGRNRPKDQPACRVERAIGRGRGDAVFQDIRLPGQWEQFEAGLFQNWHRDYDPTIGRYLQADPIGLAGGANLYGYVGGEPLGRMDPRGLLDVYIGGLGDRYGGPMQDYYNRLPPHERPTSAYFRQDQVSEAIDFINKYQFQCDEPLNIIGHSYGGDAAIKVARGANRNVQNLIGLDPVSKPGWGGGKRPPNVENVAAVNATNPSPGVADGIEATGKVIGGGVPRAYRNADSSYSAPVNHADVPAMVATSRPGWR